MFNLMPAQPAADCHYEALCISAQTVSLPRVRMAVGRGAQKPYVVYRRPCHRVDRDRQHSADAGVRWRELRQSRLDERTMACRAPRVACTVDQVLLSSTKCSGRYEMGLLVHRRLAIPLSEIRICIAHRPPGDRDQHGDGTSTVRCGVSGFGELVHPVRQPTKISLLHEVL